MFHVEMRMGMNVVREFNLSEQRLWLEFLAPLMADQPFAIEDHEFVPRNTRIKVYEGDELRLDQLGMGRGWQNVERHTSDVTERVLARAREHVAANPAPQPHPAPTATVAAPPPSTAADLLRERLIGRLSGGPIAAAELLAIAAELMPESSDEDRLEAVRHATWALLERDVAQLAPFS